MKTLKSVIGALILSTSLLYADYCNPASYPTLCCSEGEWEFAGEWLYFLNGVDQPYYVQESIITSGFLATVATDRHASKQKWHSGYRVEGVYSFCSTQNDIRFRWTSLPEFSDSESFEISGGFLGAGVLPTIGLPVIDQSISLNNASIRNQYSAYSAELLFDQQICLDAPFTFAIEAGLQYAYIHMVQDIVYTISSGNLYATKFTSKRYGIGPEIGFVFSSPICNNFHFRMRGDASLLIAKKRLNYFSRAVVGDSSGSEEAKDDTYWIFMPYVDLRLGLAYARAFNPCGCHFNMVLEGGYEVMNYFNGVDNTYTFSYSNFPQSSLNNYMSFMQHGPYLRLAINF